MSTMCRCPQQEILCSILTVTRGGGCFTWEEPEKFSVVGWTRQLVFRFRSEPEGLKLSTPPCCLGQVREPDQSGCLTSVSGVNDLGKWERRLVCPLRKE